MSTMSDGAAQAAAWLAAAGAFSGGVGSAVRAWFAIKEYEDLLQRAKIPSLVSTVMRHAFVPSLGVPVINLVVVFKAQRKVIRNLAVIRNAGGDDARRLGELANQAFAWSMLLLGAAAILASSVVRLVSAYH